MPLFGPCSSQVRSPIALLKILKPIAVRSGSAFFSSASPPASSLLARVTEFAGSTASRPPSLLGMNSASSSGFRASSGSNSSQPAERANFLSLTLPDLNDEQGGNELSSLLPPAEEKRTKNQQLQRHSRSSPTPSPRQANSSSAPLAIPTVDSKDDVAAGLTLTRLKLVLTNHANQFKEMEIREEESKMRIRQLTSSNSMLEQSSFRADSFPLMSRVQDCALRKRS